MRRRRRAHRPPGEERAAQVGRAAARPRDQAARRPVERREFAGQDACLPQHLERPRPSRDVDLATRSLLEATATVGSDLGLDAEGAQEAEGPPSYRRASEIELHRDVAARAQVEAPRAVEERRELREPVALIRWRDRG